MIGQKLCRRAAWHGSQSKVHSRERIVRKSWRWHQVMKNFTGAAPLGFERRTTVFLDQVRNDRQFEVTSLSLLVWLDKKQEDHSRKLIIVTLSTSLSFPRLVQIKRENIFTFAQPMAIVLLMSRSPSGERTVNKFIVRCNIHRISVSIWECSSISPWSASATDVCNILE